MGSEPVSDHTLVRDALETRRGAAEEKRGNPWTGARGGRVTVTPSGARRGTGVRTPRGVDVEQKPDWFVSRL